MFPPLILYQLNLLSAFSSNLLRTDGVNLGHLPWPLWIYSWSSKPVIIYLLFPQSCQIYEKRHPVLAPVDLEMLEWSEFLRVTDWKDIYAK